MDQPGKVANPARGQLKRENDIPLSSCVPENLVSRDGFSRPVPRQPAHLHAQAESSAYLRDSSRVPRRRPFMKPPYAIGSVPSLAIAYRWRSLPRVRRHRASKPQSSSERVLPWQVTMDQLIFASLSHTHYWYEVGMLKVRRGGRIASSPNLFFYLYWYSYIVYIVCDSASEFGAMGSTSFLGFSCPKLLVVFLNLIFLGTILYFSRKCWDFLWVLLLFIYFSCTLFWVSL